ncbi:Rid family detoxifying hydrolase [Traorella massiliensis]|uniref:RidA family protein n=1 Tax=Traorella massiliensis TaxID=1903263 RepID=UPI0008F7FC28|nr:Rid family detoxifying hydrolase [Traorella massiliensis]
MFIKSFEAENGPAAIGPYSPAVKLGDFVYVSGQLPINENNEIDESIALQTKACLENMKKLLATQNLELRHVVKTTVFMTDLADFDKFNEVYAQYFEKPYPARSCVQVAALPKGAKVEIEALVIDTLVYEANMKNKSCSGCQGSDCSGCR